MKRNLFAVCILSFGLASVSSARGLASSAENDTHYTQAQLKQMARDAHTPEQYNALAGYYEKQQSDYLHQATEEKQEWVRRSQNIVSIAAKYPRPVDSARYLYEYYAYKAAEAGQLAAKYSQLSAPGVPATAK
jgi:hypothetical protein